MLLVHIQLLAQIHIRKYMAAADCVAARHKPRPSCVRERNMSQHQNVSAPASQAEQTRITCPFCAADALCTLLALESHPAVHAVSKAAKLIHGYGKAQLAAHMSLH